MFPTNHAATDGRSAKDQALNTPEILNMISSHISNKPKLLARCMRVRKAWTYEAAAVLYREINGGFLGVDETREVKPLRRAYTSDITNMNTRMERRIWYAQFVRQVGDDYTNITRQTYNCPENTFERIVDWCFIRKFTMNMNFMRGRSDDPRLIEQNANMKLFPHIREIRILSDLRGFDDSFAYDLKALCPYIHTVLIMPAMQISKVTNFLRAFPYLKPLGTLGNGWSVNWEDEPDVKKFLTTVAHHKSLKRIAGLGITLPAVRRLLEGKAEPLFQSLTHAHILNQPFTRLPSSEFLEFPQALELCLSMMHNLVHVEIRFMRLKALQVVSEMDSITSVTIAESNYDIQDCGVWTLEYVSTAKVLEVLSKIPKLKNVHLKPFQISPLDTLWTPENTVIPRDYFIPGVSNRSTIPRVDLKKFVDQKPSLLEVSVERQKLPHFSKINILHNYGRLKWTRYTDKWEVTDWEAAQKIFKRAVGAREGSGSTAILGEGYYSPMFQGAGSSESEED